MTELAVPPERVGELEIDPRSNKKLKQSMLPDVIPEEMEVQETDPVVPAVEPRPELSWSAKLFAGFEPSTDIYPHYYMGKDEEERFESVDELFRCPSELEDCPPKFGPRLEISKEKYTSLFRQWQGALIIKLLGRTVGYRMLDQRLRKLWQLDKGFELTDLKDDFYIVRFFAREDYLHVLEEGPWMVSGHYLTVTKWRPLFHPSSTTFTSTLVWVRFLRIYPEMLDKEILSSMGDLISKMVKVDSMSLTGMRGRFARVC